MLLSQHPCPPLPEDLPNRAKKKKLETNPLQSANTDDDPHSTTNRERICNILAEHYIAHRYGVDLGYIFHLSFWEYWIIFIETFFYLWFFDKTNCCVCNLYLYRCRTLIICFIWVKMIQGTKLYVGYYIINNTKDLFTYNGRYKQWINNIWCKMYIRSN